jgi:hypothetical protein
MARQQLRGEPYQPAFSAKYDSKKHAAVLSFRRCHRIMDARDVS